MDSNNKIAVKNRSSSIVVYSIPEMSIRREYAPGETKRVSREEIEALSYRSGGMNLMKRFLQIEESMLNEISMTVEPEYWLDDEGVKKLLATGSLDEFLDCLDFAPSGVIDLVKKNAISLPLNDVAKREALLKKTGFDVDTVLRNQKLAKEDEPNIEQPAPQRRVQKADTGRRTAPNYKVISQETPKGV